MTQYGGQNSKSLEQEVLALVLCSFSNSLNQRKPENKPVKSGVQDCSNSLILLEPDGHQKSFA